MEGVVLEHCYKFKPSTINMAHFNSCLSDKIDQHVMTTDTHISIILQLIISKGFVASFLKTIWDGTDSFANQYPCAYSIYLLSYIAS